jgi:hypothetical protein
VWRRIEYSAIDQPLGDRLLDNGVEDVLGRSRAVNAETVLAQVQGVEYLSGQFQRQNQR